jgi:hypothetical protein
MMGKPAFTPTERRNMKQYYLWHAKESTEFGPEDDEFPEAYELVARVSARDSRHVLELTNDIGFPWWGNSNIQCFHPIRWTWRGDVITDEENRSFRVESLDLNIRNATFRELPLRNEGQPGLEVQDLWAIKGARLSRVMPHESQNILLRRFRHSLQSRRRSGWGTRAVIPCGIES